MRVPASPSASAPLPVMWLLEPVDLLPSLIVTCPFLVRILPFAVFAEVSITSIADMSMLPNAQEKTVHAAMAVALA